jgi:hypothetical protein
LKLIHLYPRLVLLSLSLLLLSCQNGGSQIFSQNLLPPPGSLQAQSASRLQGVVLSPESVPIEVQTRTQAQAQNYADEISRRREIDLFYVHSVPVALELKMGSQKAWVLSYPGTSRVRTDLNLELRALVSGTNTALNLNFSGPVTLGKVSSALNPDQKLLSAATTAGISFELITGLPGNGVTEAYGDYLDNLSGFLSSRFQARPFSFDDGPLIYAVHQGQTLLGFVFLNQRNRLILGERKYADVQSVVMVSAQREILATYTLVGFNPKTNSPADPPVYTRETQGELGELFIFGEY